MLKKASLGDWALVVGLLGSLWGYSEYHFAHADTVATANVAFDSKIALIVQSQASGRAERIEFQNRVEQNFQDIKESLGRIEGKP